MPSRTPACPPGTQQSLPATAGPRVDHGARCWSSSEDAKGRSSEMVKVHNFSIPCNNPKNTRTFETFCRTTTHCGFWQTGDLGRSKSKSPSFIYYIPSPMATVLTWASLVHVWAGRLPGRSALLSPQLYRDVQKSSRQLSMKSSKLHGS